MQIWFYGFCALDLDPIKNNGFTFTFIYCSCCIRFQGVNYITMQYIFNCHLYLIVYDHCSVINAVFNCAFLITIKGNLYQLIYYDFFFRVDTITKAFQRIKYELFSLEYSILNLYIYIRAFLKIATPVDKVSQSFFHCFITIYTTVQCINKPGLNTLSMYLVFLEN